MGKKQEGPRRLRCPVNNCTGGKLPCPHGYLHGHNLGTKENPDMCMGSTCTRCNGTGFVEGDSI